MKRSSVRPLGALLLVALLAGCSGLTSNQVVKVQSFGAATASVGKIGEEELVNIRNSIIDMNERLVAIDKTKRANDVVFDEPVFAAPTAKRVTAAKALKLYGEVLVKLATDDRSGGLQSAANSLVDNTSSALGGGMNDNQKNAINTLIVGIGNYWVERKKADAALAIIPAYQQPVNDLADLLSADFALGEGAAGYVAAYNNAAARLRNAAMRVINGGDKYSVLERERAVEALVVADKARTRAAALSTQATRAFQELKKANNDLVKVITNKQYTLDDIKNYAKQIQELANVYQVLGH